MKEIEQGRYNFTIYEANYGQISKFKSLAEKEQVQIKKDKGKTRYLGAYNYHHLIGFAGWAIIGEKIRYKADFVYKKWRGMGVYTKLWEAREKEVLKIIKDKEIKSITAYCTKRSLPMFLKNGFNVVSKQKNGITFVEKKIKKHEIVQEMD